MQEAHIYLLEHEMGEFAAPTHKHIKGSLGAYPHKGSSQAFFPFVFFPAGLV